MGEGEAAMGLLDRLFKIPQVLTCGEKTSVEAIKKEQAKIRKRLDNISATLNGEDSWFLRLEKHDDGERT